MRHPKSVGSTGRAAPPIQAAGGTLPLLIGLPVFCDLVGVSKATGKRLARDLPDLTVHIGRRLLFKRVAVEEWVEHGCPRSA
jgi:hypothetical protein